MNGYDLSREFWNWAFDNPEKITPNHSAIYFFAIEHCNRLGGREKFGFPTMMVCDAIGIKKASTYMRYFNDLVEWGFFELVQKSSNQYSANIICLTSAKPKKGKALDKAIMNHRDKQTESTGKSKRPVDKQLNNLTTKQIDARKLAFKNLIISSRKDYKQNTLKDFFEYWTEHGDKDKKMRFEKEKSFSVDRRLSTWAKRDFNKTEHPEEEKGKGSGGVSMEELYNAD